MPGRTRAIARTALAAAVPWALVMALSPSSLADGGAGRAYVVAEHEYARPLAPFAAAKTSLANRAATHAYLAAEYALQQALTADASGRIVAARSLAGQISAECPGILSHAPTPAVFEAAREGPRQLGERNRRREQLSALTRELARALLPPLLAPEREAVAAFIAGARRLRWSGPAVTAGVDSYLSLLEQQEPRESAPPHVCADIGVWIASGYRLLSPATKALLAAADVPPTIKSFGTTIAPTSPALAPDEGPSERHLLAQIRDLRRRRLNPFDNLSEILENVEAALGIHRSEGEPGLFPRRTPVPGAVVLGRGRTAAGNRFTVTFEPSGHGEPGCSLQIAERGGGSEVIGTRWSPCSFRSAAAEASVNCNEGLLTILANTLPATRRVRLLLSNGRAITTPAILIPARYGGPAGLYYQIVRGPAPIPIALTELDRREHALRTDHLPKILECTRHPLKFLPGGIRTLVRSHVPGGPAFTIEAQRYRFLGQIHLDLKANVEEGSGIVGGIIFSAGSDSHPLRAPGRNSILAVEESSGCKPAPYMIVFGVLKRPADTVLARTAAGLMALHKQPMPAALHAGGVLVWSVFSPPPTELLVRAPDGRTLARESIAETATAQVEQCEGEAETPQPPTAHG